MSVPNCFSSQEERLKIYEEAQKILINEEPWVPLWVNETVTATRGIKGVIMNPYTQGMILSDVTIDK